MAIASVARLLIRDPKEQRQFLYGLVHRKSKVLLGAMGVELEVEGRENFKPGQNYLIAANHLSYLDPLILASVRPMAFVTSIEMKQAFFLGTLTELGGCLYVERRSRGNIRREISEIENALRAGFHVAIFPEATSTDGSKILPFKRPLFSAAIHSARNVLPVMIQYEEIDGQRVSTRNRDRVCWYGDMRFGRHFVRLLDFQKIRIRVTIIPEIPVTPGSERDTITENAYRAISEIYIPIA
jgi:1-acyl-sn-glycerol-3-phosphate acyltransferase